MSETRNLAVLLVRGGDPAVLGDLVEAHRGEPHGEQDGARVFAFSSPTDAVLAGLAAAGGPGGRCAAGVALGEVVIGEGSLEGKAADVALALTDRAGKGQVLMVEAVYLAMNRVEVGASPTNLEPGDRISQRIYRAEARAAAPAPAEDDLGSPEAAGAVGGRGLGSAVLLLVAVAVGGFLARGGGAHLPSVSGTLAARAEELSRKGQHREAAAAFLAAYREDPGTAIHRARYRESVLQAAAAFEQGGRLDAAFGVLADAVEEDPFRVELEDRLVEIGWRYLETLLELESREAYARVEPRLRAALPLREQEIRDHLVGVKARAAMKEWRKHEIYRLKNEVFNKRIAPLWDESPDHPELWLVQAEADARDGRYDNVVKALTNALDRKPEWRTERPEVKAAVLESLKEMDSAYERKRYLAPLVDFCAQRVPELVEGAIPDLIAGDAVGGRISALRFAEARGTATDEDAFRVHKANVLGVRAMGDKESPLKDPELIREAVAFAARAPAGMADELRRAMEAGSRMEEATPEVRDLLRAGREGG